MVGKIKWSSKIPIHIIELPLFAASIAVIVPNWPTNPQVPIPEPIGIFSILKTVVDKGPIIADARVGGCKRALWGE